MAVLGLSIRNLTNRINCAKGTPDYCLARISASHLGCPNRKSFSGSTITLLTFVKRYGDVYIQVRVYSSFSLFLRNGQRDKYAMEANCALHSLMYIAESIDILSTSPH